MVSTRTRVAGTRSLLVSGSLRAVRKRYVLSSLEFSQICRLAVPRRSTSALLPAGRTAFTPAATGKAGHKY